MSQQPMPLPVHSYRRTGSRGQRLVNCFAEPSKAGAESAVSVFGALGVSGWGVTMPDVGCRGVCERLHKGRIAAVRGNSLYLVAQDGSWERFPGIPGSGRVSIASVGDELIVVARPKAYVLKQGVLSEVTNADFTGYRSIFVTELDGYAIHAAEDSQVFFKSELYDAAAYTADEFDLKSTYSDDLVAVYGVGNRLFVIGTESIEPYYNSGASPFPYSRDPNGALNLGCQAPHTLVQTEQGFYFLGSDNSFYFMPAGGVLPVEISRESEAVVDAVERMTVRSDAWAFIVKMQGHRFVHFVFPTEEQCWVYDENTGLWHERESYQVPLDIAGCASAWGKHIVFRRSSGEMGEMGRDAEGEWDNALLSSWTYSNVYASGRLASHNMMTVAIDTGYGATHGNVPQLMLEISDDGGEVFRVGPEAAMGDRGQFGRRVNHTRLGSAVNRVYRHSLPNMGRRQVRDAQLWADGAYT